MPALVRAKNTVTVSIIINFLVRAPHANVTTGHAAQSKGFRSGKRQSDPTDDFGQQRRAPGQKTPLKGHADRCPGNRRGRPWSRPAGASVSAGSQRSVGPHLSCRQGGCLIANSRHGLRTCLDRCSGWRVAIAKPNFSEIRIVPTAGNKGVPQADADLELDDQPPYPNTQ